jgi:hypothetical protein
MIIIFIMTYGMHHINYLKVVYMANPIYNTNVKFNYY